MEVYDSRYIGKRVYGRKNGLHHSLGVLVKIIVKGKNRTIVYQIKCSDGVTRNFSGIYVPMYN